MRARRLHTEKTHCPTSRALSLSNMAKNQQWLEDTLQEARDRNWCTKCACTTCGAWEFRTAYLCRAAEHAGVVVPGSRHLSTFKSSFQSLSREESEKIFSALTAALREVGPQWRHTEALRLILLELPPPLIKWGVGVTLDDLLAGTPAGDEYLAMQAHDTQRATARSKLAAYEAAAPERRTAKKREAQIEHSVRLKESAERKRSRESLLDRFAALTGVKRLVLLAEQPDDFPLGMIPTELIPTAEYASELSQEQRSRLMEIIGRRKGRWDKLRTGLGQISAE
jgi:hypothetical protein